MSRNKLRLAAAALSLGVVCAMGSSNMAFADATDPSLVGGVSQAAANPALVNGDATVQLNITKHLGAPVGGYDDGTANTTVGLPTLAQVDFDVYQVLVNGAPVDLTTNAGWEAASALTGEAAKTFMSTGTVTIGDDVYTRVFAETVTTGTNGVATFKKVDGVGLYLVAENLETSGTMVDGVQVVYQGTTAVPVSTITPSSPFLVTLPMTNPDTEASWMYDVFVYPKNQTDSITKAVEDKGTVTTDNGNVGDHGIDYTITSSITDGTNPLGMYVIYDDLHESLTFTGATLALSDGTPLVTGTHYTVYTSPDWMTAATPYAEGTKVAGGPVVTIVFTEAGLAVLEANRDDSVVTKLSTTVGAEDADGVVENEASFIPNESWWDQNMIPGVDPETPDVTPPGEDPGTPSNEVETKYGDVLINKYDPQPMAEGSTLAGAVFAIYADSTDPNGQCTALDVTGTPINTATVAAVVKPGPDGVDGTADDVTTYEAMFEGLQTSNWYDGKEQTLLQGYCVVETKAPEGYNLDATPRYVTIDWTTGTETAPALAKLDVANEKSNLDNNLPLTGGEGVAALSLGGLALIGGGLAYYGVSSRRRRQA